MNILPTAIPDVKLLQPQVHGDERGFFMETFRDNWFREHIAPRTFVQENHSKSGQGVLRGLHYQTENTQGKLVRVIAGEVFDVAVDLRRSSPLLANGPVPFSPPKTNTSSGYPKASPTASMY